MNLTSLINNIRKILWYAILALPLFCFALSFVENSNFLTFDGFFATNFTILTNNPIYDCFDGLFGSDGIIPVFGTGLLSYFTYFVAVELIHIVVDVLLLLPSMIHNLFDKVGGGKNDF